MTKEDQFEALPSQEYLALCFAYCPETGALTWRARPASHFAHCKREATWEMKRRNSLYAGRDFGARNTDGHIRGGLDGTLYYAHRLIWKLFYGEEPAVIDHINGDPSDNRSDNLRSGTRSDNQRNMKLSASNTSGSPGVYSHKQSGGWHARINSPAGTKLNFYSKNREEVETWRRERELQFGYSGRARA